MPNGYEQLGASEDSIENSIPSLFREREIDCTSYTHLNSPLYDSTFPPVDVTFTTTQEFVEIIDSVREGIKNGFDPIRITKGSSGSYFCRNKEGVIVGVFKPKNEEPYGHLNPKWTKWVHRNLFPCCFGRQCIIPNLGYISEAAASFLDRKLGLYIVPRTEIVKLSSPKFHYSFKERWAHYLFKKPLPPKIGSFQLFLVGYQDSSSFFKSGYAQLENSENQPLQWSAVTKRDFQNGFERLVILDYLIRNTDRSSDNWMIRTFRCDDTKKKHIPKMDESENSIAGSSDQSTLRVQVAAIDHGLAFPTTHPTRLRSYPFGWLDLPVVNIPFAEHTVQRYLSLLKNKAWWEETLCSLEQIFAIDKNFDPEMWAHQKAVLRGQHYNLLEAFEESKDRPNSPFDLVQKPPVKIYEEPVSDSEDEGESSTAGFKKRLKKRSSPEKPDQMNPKIPRVLPKVLTLKTANDKVVKFEYAVRGRLAIRSEQLKEEIAKNPNAHPFKTIINCNIGNPQSLNQKPITFFRQVAAMIEYPDLEHMAKLPSDVVKRAKEHLVAMGGSVGAYSPSQGIPLVRKRVAEFIERRDGFPSDPSNIFLTTGASEGVKSLLQVLISKPSVGIMIPIPQYPLYTATIAMNGGQMVPYLLDEYKDWNMSVEELEKQYKEAVQKGIEVRALCVINPGNPTGQCLTQDNMKEIVKFCHRNNLVLLADEVYQANVYDPKRPFVSFKKVLCQMGSEYKDLELVSFHSISKGLIGECGRRGGYFETVNIDKDVNALLYKMLSVSLCSPVHGQVMMELMVNPPKKGDPSYDLFAKESSDIYESLKRRANKIQSALNKMEGVSCNQAQGAMYLFPRVTLSPKAIEAAKKEGMPPDEFYCIELLNNTGVCVIPGSGFGQEEGTWHYRCTFLPEEKVVDEFVGSILKFHQKFMDKYR